MFAKIFARPTRKFDGFRLLFWLVLAGVFVLGTIGTAPGHVLSPFGDHYTGSGYTVSVQR